MKNYLALLLLLLVIGLRAQTGDAPPADFAIVDLDTKHGGDAYVCIVKYSDGKEFSLDKTLRMTVAPNHAVTQADMVEQQFKVLSYFSQLGYTIVNIALVPNFQDGPYTVIRENNPSIRFYFKKRGL